MPFQIKEKFVVETETVLGATLPSWFRIKMMSENGGELPAIGDIWELIPSKTLRTGRHSQEHIIIY
jgi:hypothetical protein